MNKTKSFVIGLLAGIVTVVILSIVIFLSLGHITSK